MNTSNSNSPSPSMDLSLRPTLKRPDLDNRHRNGPSHEWDLPRSAAELTAAASNRGRDLDMKKVSFDRRVMAPNGENWTPTRDAPLHSGREPRAGSSAPDSASKRMPSVFGEWSSLTQCYCEWLQMRVKFLSLRLPYLEGLLATSRFRGRTSCFQIWKPYQSFIKSSLKEWAQP